MRQMFTTEEWNNSNHDAKIVMGDWNYPFRGGEIISSNPTSYGLERGPFFMYTKWSEKWVEMLPDEVRAHAAWQDAALQMVLDVMG